MYFPSSGSGKPYCRIDGRSGTFALSTADGDPEVVEMRGQLLDIDLRQARQGWLAFSTAGADFVALETRDAWSGTPRPSPDHAPAVELDVSSPDWPEPRVRQLRASSRCVTSFVARIAEAASEVPEDRVVRVKITGANVVKFGRGSSADITFNVAPREKWPQRDFFDAAAEAIEAEEPKPAQADATGFDEDADAWG
jgi:hypothetical protein